MSNYVTALAIVAATVCPANSFAERSCTLRTLKGQFVFTGRGLIEAQQPGVQRVNYGIFLFGGAGKFTGNQSSRPWRKNRSREIGRNVHAGE
jgi:hypothetical protein